MGKRGRRPRAERRERERSSVPGTESPSPGTPPIEPALPEDIEIAHRMIRDLLEQLRSSRRNEDQLRQRIEDLIRQFYGRKAEKVDPDQLLLFAADDLTRFRPEEPEQSGAADGPENHPAPPKRKRGRRALPKNLPRRRILHEIPEAERLCPCCNDPMGPIREEVSEQLDYQPASLVVLEHVRLVYGCAKKCDEAIAIATKPDQPIEKGIPGPGLLAHVVGSKYGDHLPLYRQENIFGRNGADLGRSTMCGWIRAAAELVMPLILFMKAGVLRSFCVATDETSLLVLDRANKRTFKGRLWVFCGDREHPWLVYDYTPTRERDGPEAFLGDYEGYLQADAYTGYDGLYAPGRITEVGCWMHGRRYWYKASLVDPAIPMQAIAMIGLLYEFEKTAKNFSAEDRYAYRQERAVPVLDRMEEWLEDVRPSILPKSPAGDALRYTTNQWRALRRYTEDGRLEIDNGRSERGLRIVALGRRNWLFAGSPEGGRRAANLFSLTGTCMLNGIDPETYLRDLFRELPGLPESQLHEWTPVAWAARQAEA